MEEGSPFRRKGEPRYITSRGTLKEKKGEITRKKPRQNRGLPSSRGDNRDADTAEEGTGKKRAGKSPDDFQGAELQEKGSRDGRKSEVVKESDYAEKIPDGEGLFGVRERKIERKSNVCRSALEGGEKLALAAKKVSFL